MWYWIPMLLIILCFKLNIQWTCWPPQDTITGKHWKLLVSNYKRQFIWKNGKNSKEGCGTRRKWWTWDSWVQGNGGLLYMIKELNTAAKEVPFKVRGAFWLPENLTIPVYLILPFMWWTWTFLLKNPQTSVVSWTLVAGMGIVTHTTLLLHYFGIDWWLTCVFYSSGKLCGQCHFAQFLQGQWQIFGE